MNFEFLKKNNYFETTKINVKNYSILFEDKNLQIL